MVIKIKNFRVRTTLGIYDYEKKNRREVLMNIELLVDGSVAGRSDVISDTVDYEALQSRISTFAENRSFELLEKLTTDVLATIMTDPKIKKATLEIDKPGATPYAESVSITMHRSRTN